MHFLELGATLAGVIEDALGGKLSGDERRPYNVHEKDS